MIRRKLSFANRSYKDASGTLTGVAHWVGHCSTKQKVTGLIPGQGTCLGRGCSPWLGHVWEAADRYVSLTSMFLSLSPSFPLSLNRNK